jgi:hypothetical protein
MVILQEKKGAFQILPDDLLADKYNKALVTVFADT